MGTPLKEKPFWVHLLIIIGIVCIVLFGFLQLLGVITGHGKYLTVPSVTGLPTAQAIKLLEDKGFDVQIQDSVYTDSVKMGLVLKQFPDPNSTVKVNRTVLLTVNRVTLPMVSMPSLQGKSLLYALEILRRTHLILGDTTTRPDFMMGSVLEQRFNGKLIISGDQIPWGSRIDLVIGGGLSEVQIPVPSLTGLTFGAARTILDSSGIMLGSLQIDPDVSDTASAFIYKQIPPKYTEDKHVVFIHSGQVMDLWLSKTPRVLSDSSSQNSTTP